MGQDYLQDETAYELKILKYFFHTFSYSILCLHSVDNSRWALKTAGNYIYTVPHQAIRYTPFFQCILMALRVLEKVQMVQIISERLRLDRRVKYGVFKNTYTKNTKNQAEIFFLVPKDVQFFTLYEFKEWFTIKLTQRTLPYTSKFSTSTFLRQKNNWRCRHQRH